MTSNWLGKRTINASSRHQGSFSGLDLKLSSDQTTPHRPGAKASSSSSAARPSAATVTDINGRRDANLPSARQSNLIDFFHTRRLEPMDSASGARPRARTEEAHGKGKGRRASWEREEIEVVEHRAYRSTTPMSAALSTRIAAQDSIIPAFSMSSPSQAHLTKSSAALEWMSNGRSRLRPLSSEDEIDVKLELSPQEIDQQTQQEAADLERVNKRRKRSPLAAPSRETVPHLDEAEDIEMDNMLRSRPIKAERSVDGEALSQSVHRVAEGAVSPSFQTAHSSGSHLDRPAGSRIPARHPDAMPPSSPRPRSPSLPSSPLLSESLLPLLPASYPSPIQHSESLLRVFAPMGKDSAARLRMLRRDQFAWESDEAFAKRKRELAEVEARKAEEEKIARERIRGVWEPPLRPSKKQRTSDVLQKARERPLVSSPGPKKAIEGRGAREALQEELEEEEEDAILQAITISSVTPDSLSKHNRHHNLSPLQTVGPLRVQGAPSPRRAQPASSQQTYSHTQASESSSQTQSQLIQARSVQSESIRKPPQGTGKLSLENSAVRSSVSPESSMSLKKRGKGKEQNRQDTEFKIVDEEPDSGTMLIHSSIPVESSRWILRRQSLPEQDEHEEKLDRAKDHSEGRSEIGDQEKLSLSVRHASRDQTPTKHPHSSYKSPPPHHHSSSPTGRQPTTDVIPVSHRKDLEFRSILEDDEIAIPSSQMNERLSPLRRLNLRPTSPKIEEASFRVPPLLSESLQQESTILPAPPAPSVKAAPSKKKRKSGSWNFSSLLAHPVVSNQKTVSRSSSPSAPPSPISSSQNQQDKRRIKVSDSQLEQRSPEKSMNLQQSSLLTHFQRTTIPNPKRFARFHGLDEELDDIELSGEDNDEETAVIENRRTKREGDDRLDTEAALTEPASSSEYVIPNSQPSPKNHFTSLRKRAPKVMGKVPSPPPRNLLLPQSTSRSIPIRTSDPEKDDQTEEEDDIVPETQFGEERVMMARRPALRGRPLSHLRLDGLAQNYERAARDGEWFAEEAEDRLDESVQEGGSLTVSHKPAMVEAVGGDGSECTEEEEGEEGDTTIVPDEPPIGNDNDLNVDSVPVRDPIIGDFESTGPTLDILSLTSLSSDPVSIDTLARRSDESISFWRFAAPSSDDPSA